MLHPLGCEVQTKCGAFHSPHLNRREGAQFLEHIFRLFLWKQVASYRMRADSVNGMASTTFDGVPFATYAMTIQIRMLY